MEVEDALAKLGSFGRWQVSFFLLLSTFQGIFPAFHMLSLVWISHTPEHHCRIAKGASLNDSIPRDSYGKLSQCLKYVNRTLDNQTMACDDGWVYDPTDSYTIVNKWNLVCDKEMWNQLSQTILVAGVMVGAFCFSVLSDKLGRKPIFLVTQVMLVVVGTACALIENFYIFLFLRFLTGMLQQGILLSGFVLVTELFSMKNRSFAGTIIQVFWGLGVALLAFLAYLIPNWAYLQMLISILGLLVLPLFWLMPESVSWLYANGHVDKAEIIIRKAAKLNKIELSNTIFKINGLVEKTEKKSHETNDRSASQFSKETSIRLQLETSYTLLDVVKSRKLMTFLSIASFAWISITLVFYGLTFSTDGLKGNRFLNGFISGIIEVPAYILTFILLKRFGRKIPFLTLLIIAGIFVLLMFFIPNKIAGTNLYFIPIVLSVVGKFCITVTFAILFLYVSELFPTNLRNQALGITSFFGRFGNLLATFTLYFMKEYPAVPSLVFSSLSFLTAFLILFLPETHGRPLPQTIKEIESWKKILYVKVADPQDKTTLLDKKTNDV